jgi:hypothetical protein
MGTTKEHSMRFVIALALISLTGCPDDSDPMAGFRGSYTTTINLNGAAYKDSMHVDDGTTSDLILDSQQLGAVKANVLGGDSFSIDQQSITLSSSSGAFAVNIEGQGTVDHGVFNASGTLSTSSGVLPFTIAGSKL